MNDPTPFPKRRTTPGGRLVAVVASTSDAELVHAARAGDRRAFSTLFERWFDRSYDVAWRIVRNPDTAAEVAQDTFLVAWQKLDSLRDAEAFGGWILRTARNRALNRLEREGRSRAFDTDDTVAMVDRERSALDVADEIVRQEQHDLVWAAAAALGERDASILDLHLRHDLDPAQIAETLDITPNAAHQTLFRLRKRLEGAIRSYVLWHDGRPECGELAEALDASGITAFGPAAVKAISTHVTTCDVCDERHAAILAPASMFAAVPIVAVGLDVKRAAAAELASHGVPIDLDLVTGASGGTAPGAPPASSSDGDGLVLPSHGAPARRQGYLLGGMVAVAVLVVAVVAGVALSRGSEPTEAETVAAPATTVTSATSVPRVLGSVVAPSTTEVIAVDDEPADAPPQSTEPPLVTQPPPAPTTTGTTATTSPATTTSTTSTTPETTTSTTSPPPVFTVLSLTEIDLGLCRGTSGRIYELSWSTSDATSVYVAGPGVTAGWTAPSGSLEVCSPMGTSDTWPLRAEGPGGLTATSISSSP
jgi:RNA polymerase sigma factor (sigma-70 family)